jgi:hypothetical protein
VIGNVARWSSEYVGKVTLLGSNDTQILCGDGETALVAGTLEQPAALFVAHGGGIQVALLAQQFGQQLERHGRAPRYHRSAASARGRVRRMTAPSGDRRAG